MSSDDGSESGSEDGTAAARTPSRKRRKDLDDEAVVSLPHTASVSSTLHVFGQNLVRTKWCGHAVVCHLGKRTFAHLVCARVLIGCPSAQEDAEVEGYFESQALDAVTSDRTLAKLEMPRMDPETLAATLRGEAGRGGAHSESGVGLM